jgi:hypothetical protein
MLPANRRQRMGADLDPITDAAAGARFIASPSFYRLGEPSFYRSYPAPLVVVGTRDGVRAWARLTPLLQIGAPEIIKSLTMYAPPEVGGPL